MEIKVGSIVRSIAGHDKGSLLLVVGLDNGYAYVADGKLRKIEKPKKKKLKHLQGSLNFAEKEFSENYQIREILLENVKRG